MVPGSSPFDHLPVFCVGKSETRSLPLPTRDVGGSRSSMVIPPHNSPALRAQYAHDRDESGPCGWYGEKPTQGEHAAYAPSTSLVPTDAPSDRPGCLAKRDRLGRLDVAPG